MRVEDENKAMQSASPPRKRWSEQFEAMADNGDDQLLDGEVVLSNWEWNEWE